MNVLAKKPVKTGNDVRDRFDNLLEPSQPFLPTHVSLRVLDSDEGACGTGSKPGVRCCRVTPA